jgi:hypothetical protein
MAKFTIFSEFTKPKFQVINGEKKAYSVFNDLKPKFMKDGEGYSLDLYDEDQKLEGWKWDIGKKIEFSGTKIPNTIPS